MTRARTAIALLFHVLLLHVSVLGGGMACAPAWTSLVRATPAAAAPSAAHHGGQHEAAQHEAAQHEAAQDADAPAPHHDGALAHCVTASGCAAVAVDAPEVTPASLAAVSAKVARVRVRVPASTRAAPEPPPPRA